MMKRLLSLCLCLVLLLALVPAARADVIWEPYGDRFYESHQEDFSRHSEVYYCNSLYGSVEFYDKPNGTVIGSQKNGTVIGLTYLYDNGKDPAWGLSELYLDGQWTGAYVLMSELLNRYDKEFFSDHETQTEPPEGLEAFCSEKQILYWTYPGGSYHKDFNRFQDSDITAYCQWFYTDEDGNVWGYVGYHMGHVESWICLTDVMNEALAKEPVYLGEVRFGDGYVPAEKPPVEQKNLALPVGLSVGAGVLAGGLLLLWPKKKKER